MKAPFLILLAVLTLLIATVQFQKSDKIIVPQKPVRTWQIKSIDTMKYSRDLAEEKLNDPLFDQVIDEQIKAIGQTGATYVAIATPYDEKFVPVLARWIEAARRYNLFVWYRGNFSGWEGWFGQGRSLTRQKHLELTRQFIQNHPDIFVDGDIFSPCPECENGGPGDPRYQTGIQEFRDFMISEHKASQEEFAKVNKKVATNIAPMNFDVALLVFDEKTTKEMGSIIAIDHYVKTPQKLAQDIDELNTRTRAKIFLGEFGTPIPDITGKLDYNQQAVWVEEALRLVAQKDYVIGLNYWVSHGGSTAIFNNDNSARPAADILKKYFSITKLN